MIGLLLSQTDMTAIAGVVAGSVTRWITTAYI